MIEVYRNRDFALVGLVDGILQAEGIATVIRNRNAVTMTTEIPIPVMFPNVCVLHESDAASARAIIQAYLENESIKDSSPWTCLECGESNEGQFSECWQCQTEASTAPKE